jgi:hypothetical protein
MRLPRIAFCILVAIAFSAGPTRTADAAAIAYINAFAGSVDYLTGYGHTVVEFDNPIGLTLSDLSGFDAVLIASNLQFSEPTNIGNVAGAFADAGGGVVLTEFDFQGQWALSGQIMGPGYSPFTVDPLSSGFSISSNLGVIVDPASPLFTGVNTANVHTDFQANTLLDPGATLVATWTSGRLAIAFNTLAGSSVVGLNLYPDADWTNPDTQRLIANALQFSIENQNQPTAIPEPATITLIGVGALGVIGRRRLTSPWSRAASRPGTSDVPSFPARSIRRAVNRHN